MITLPNGKICMNEQEAIQWLLDNYPIPFQCSADYAADTEIGLGTIVNPTPAKVKVGSIIFFADSKVSTVVGLTANGFICSDQYNDLVDDIVYVSNVQLNASGHLIVTLSNATTIDAGLIKQVTGFSINASQHLIASYNDGTSTDLGAIFQGNISISGNLTVSGGISGNAITGNSIVENMSGYSFTGNSITGHTINYVYEGVVKNGNKLTLVNFLEITRNDAGADSYGTIGTIFVPSAIASKLYPSQLGVLDNVLASQVVNLFKDPQNAVSLKAIVLKGTNSVVFFIYGLSNLEVGTKYQLRFEQTFLLSDNLAA